MEISLLILQAGINFIEEQEGGKKVNGGQVRSIILLIGMRGKGKWLG